MRYLVTSFGGTEYAVVDESCPPSRYRFSRCVHDAKPMPMDEAQRLFARVQRYTTRRIDVLEVS